MESLPDLDISADFPVKTLDDWMSVVERDLKGAPFEKKLVNRLYEGIAVQPLYTRGDADSSDRAGMPGCAPFTRGAAPLGNAGSGWDIRQAVADPDPAAANEAILTDLVGGCSSFTLRLHPAARNAAKDSSGADPDGILINSLADLKPLLAGIDLGICGFALDAGAAGVGTASLLFAYARSVGTALPQLRGDCNIDPLAQLAEVGRLPVGVSCAQHQAMDLVVWCREHAPGVRVLAASSLPYHEAGADAAVELAACLSAGVAQLRAGEAAGLDAAAVAGTLSLRLAVGCEQFLEIAKLRAARRCWSRILEACGIAADQQTMHVQAVAADRMLTRYDPWVNMLRTTVSTFAGSVGGADAIEVAPFDRRLGLSDDFARRIARNTQVILHEESHLDRVVDPGGGSWYLEQLTDELAATAWAQFQKIEADGGLAQVLQDGSLKARIEAGWAKRRAALAKRKDAVTGVSEFPAVAETLPERPVPDMTALQRAAAERAAPSGTAQDLAATAVKTDSGSGVRTEALVAAFAAGSSIGAIAPTCSCGDATESPALVPVHLAGDFEALRHASDEQKAATGKRPQAFLANLGPVAHFTVRATWSRNFLEAGGFEVLDQGGFDGAAAAAAAFAASGAAIAVICSSDKLYPEHVPATATALKATGARTVVLAGRAGEEAEAWRAAGVDRFIHLGCPVLDILTELLNEEGVLS